MATKQELTEAMKVLQKLLRDGKDWETLTINGITIQKLPEGKGKPASLAVVYNPLEARRSIYIHNDDNWSTLLNDMTEKNDTAVVLLKLMGKVNPKVSAKTTVKSDFNFNL